MERGSIYLLFSRIMMQQQNGMLQGQTDINSLVDWSQPFNEQRLAALDQVVQYLYTGNTD
jgi:hypothetical protein